ncbi:MAG: PIN domain-containing protein [Proteobacteria bacterium]|nr:PIN domain-containing protein [Pseudomonadota bacterium]
MKANVLVDTSIWIEFFNHPESKNGEKLERLIVDDRVVCSGIILAELLQGAKIEKEYRAIKDNMIVFPFLEANYETWLFTGKTAYDLRRKGITVPISDTLIATLAKENNCLVFSLDNHFKKVPGINLYNGR